MVDSNSCPICGKGLAHDSPQGQCPECLLKVALQDPSMVDSAATGSHIISKPVDLPEAGVRVKYFGDYELLHEIARGGMGVVWKARQTSLKRDVALKMIRSGNLAGKDEVERFLREAEAAANLQHPNIVAIHEVGEHGGQHYFSMDYVEGRDLGSIVKDGPLTPPLAARYVKTIAETIHFAHQRGTLHRDLKPQNVLIDAADQPRITDFGLAKILKDDSQLTQPGVVMGSPSYMPPEQAAGRQADIGPASDVYSLGAMLYELLTGRPPFRGTTALATLHEVMETEPIPPRRLNTSIPTDLETICLKCLEKTPSARYPSARALAEELDRYQKGEPIQARPASSLRKVVNWVRRHPGTLVTLAAISVVSLAFGVIYLIEENAFLRAQRADPTLTRVQGPRHESLEVWHGVGVINFAVGTFLLLTVQRRARGLTWNQKINWRRPFKIGGWEHRPLQPLDDWTRGFACVGGVILLVYGVLLLVLTMQAHVWEGEPIRSQIFPIYCDIYLGIMTIGLLIRDYRMVQFGITPTPQLTRSQLAVINQALENSNWPAAIEKYRKIVPTASLAEADQFILRHWNGLRAQDPNTFKTPPVTLATLNWKAMGKGSILCTIVWVIWLITEPPTDPIFTVAALLSTLLVGMALMALRVEMPIWKRLVLFITTLEILAFEIFFSSKLVAASSHSFDSYIQGLFFGMFVMACGLARPRNKT